PTAHPSPFPTRRSSDLELQEKIKSASDKMRADDNTKNALKYLEQLTWLLFLKQWDAIESEREDIATIDGKSYERLIDGEFRWSRSEEHTSELQSPDHLV